MASAALHRGYELKNRLLITEVALVTFDLFNRNHAARSLWMKIAEERITTGC